METSANRLAVKTTALTHTFGDLIAVDRVRGVLIAVCGGLLIIAVRLYPTLVE